MGAIWRKMSIPELLLCMTAFDPQRRSLQRLFCSLCVSRALLWAQRTCPPVYTDYETKDSENARLIVAQERAVSLLERNAGERASEVGWRLRWAEGGMSDLLCQLEPEREWEKQVFDLLGQSTVRKWRPQCLANALQVHNTTLCTYHGSMEIGVSFKCLCW